MKQSYQIIGAMIKTYGHFDTFNIPNENGHGILNAEDVTLEEFLELVTKYFNDRNRINSDYGDDVKEQHETKKFIRSRITSDCEETGRLWCSCQNWKK